MRIFIFPSYRLAINVVIDVVTIKTFYHESILIIQIDVYDLHDYMNTRCRLNLKKLIRAILLSTLQINGTQN